MITPELIIIVAMAQNRVIGQHNIIPWHIPKDLQHFKTTTTGHALVMGRKTWESIGHPLPKRTNIVISRNPDYLAKGCHTVHSFDQAITYASSHHEKIFIIGGGEIYTRALPLAHTILITLLHREVAGDIFFPPIPPHFQLQHQTHHHWPEPVTLQKFSRIR